MDDYFEMNSSQKLFVSLIRKQRKEIIKKGNYGKLSFDDIIFSTSKPISVNHSAT